MSHRAALCTISIAAILDAGLGAVYAHVEHLSLGLGLYWALTTATTVGYGDLTPHTTAGHWVAALVMLTVVPLFAATFSFFTTALTRAHLSRSEARLHRHVTELANRPSPAGDQHD